MNIRATVAVPQQLVRFDDLAAPAAVDKWIETGAGLEDQGGRLDFGGLRARHAEAFAALRARPASGPALVIANGYFQECVPLPKATEGAFWSLSCLPTAASARDFVRLATLTVLGTETLWLAQALDGEGVPSLLGCLVVSGAALSETVGDLAAAGYDPDLVSLSPVQARGVPSGTAVAVHFVGVEGYLALDQLAGIDRAARTLTVALMRGGRTSAADQHCPDLADWVTRELSDDEADALMEVPGSVSGQR
jgi:hypothetical protein